MSITLPNTITKKDNIKLDIIKDTRNIFRLKKKKDNGINDETCKISI